METQEVLLRPSRSTYHTEHTFRGQEAANACNNNQNLTNLGMILAFLSYKNGND